jgi:hypothetical protein
MVIYKLEGVPVPQALNPCTVINPDLAAKPNPTVMEFVFPPDWIQAPGGNVQIYPVALPIGCTVYTTSSVALHTEFGPWMNPAAEGDKSTVTGRLEDAPFPHELVPYTVTVPEEAVAE